MNWRAKVLLADQNEIEIMSWNEMSSVLEISPEDVDEAPISTKAS